MGGKNCKVCKTSESPLFNIPCGVIDFSSKRKNKEHWRLYNSFDIKEGDTKICERCLLVMIDREEIHTTVGNTCKNDIKLQNKCYLCNAKPTTVQQLLDRFTPVVLGGRGHDYSNLVENIDGELYLSPKLEAPIDAWFCSSHFDRKMSISSDCYSCGVKNTTHKLLPIYKDDKHFASYHFHIESDDDYGSLEKDSKNSKIIPRDIPRKPWHEIHTVLCYDCLYGYCRNNFVSVIYNYIGLVYRVTGR